MLERPEEWFVQRIGKLGRQFTKNLLSAPEFVGSVLDQFADSDCVYKEIIPSLWDSVPNNVRREFVEALRAAQLPGFRYHAFEIGGSRGLTDDERRFQQERNAHRVNAWATELLQLIDSSIAKT